MAAQELRRHKSPGIDQTSPELIKVRSRKFRWEIRKSNRVNNSNGIRRNRLTSGSSRSL